MIQWIITYLIIINLVTFVLFGLDKYFAIKQIQRIPINALLICAMLGGSFLAFIAMQVFRHKTKQAIFVYLIPIFIICHCLILYTLQ